MKKRSRRKKRNIVVPIVVLIFCCIFTAMVAYGWNARKKNVKVAASKGAAETVEVNNSETSSEGETTAAPESETAQTVAETTATPESNPGPDEKVVYFTFDDGPWTGTPRLLDILDQYNIKACFFVTAQYMETEPLKNMLKQIKDRGHNVAVHSLTHNYKKIYASVDAFMSDYDAMDDLIFQATGEHSKMLRFPGGSNASYNKAIRPQLLQAVRDRGIVYFDWNSFDGDVEGKKGQELIDQTIKQVNENTHSILLMHDMPSTAFVHDALPTIIERLKADGYKFELLNENTPPRQFAK
ncbi:MAG: polysaccharide deacetylase family protein [Lachnoanaerobaculum saburreum]|jgi:hypothetical protein